MSEASKLRRPTCALDTGKHQSSGPGAAILADGKRLHLNHGPIDLIIETFGDGEDVAKAYCQATTRFETILGELVAELPLLRSPVTKNSDRPLGLVARAMHAAALSHTPRFITPMAAVAGAVADEILKALCTDTRLEKAYVNNGGDIALYLIETGSFRIGVVADPREGSLVTRAAIHGKNPVRGIATSGRHGRSHSLGIADSVTVFAGTAAIADAAATIIANDVNLPDCTKITRQPANELSPDSDLGSCPVTTGIAGLSTDEITRALDAGEQTAKTLCNSGLIEAAFLSLQKTERIIGWPIDRPLRFAPHLNPTVRQHRITHA